MSCIIVGCKTHSSRKVNDPENISFHRFPSDYNMRKKWINTIARTNWQWKKQDRVCSKHFKNDCFINIDHKWRRLKPNAVPSLRLRTEMNQGAQCENETQVFCSKCNTEISHTAEGIQEDQTKAVIAKVYHYLEQEYEELKMIYGDLDLTPLSNIRERTSKATGVSESTVLQILQEEEEENAVKQEEPPKKRRRARKRQSTTDSSNEEQNSSDDNEESLRNDEDSLNDFPVETLVVKVEPTDIDYYNEQAATAIDPIAVKEEPHDDEENNSKTLGQKDSGGTKRKGRRKQIQSGTTLEQQHTQGESTTAASSSNTRRSEELDKSGQSYDREVKSEDLEIGEEGFS